MSRLISGGRVRSVLTAAVPLLATLAATFVLLKLVDLFIGLRVTQDAEREGLDITQHGEVVH